MQLPAGMAKIKYGSCFFVRFGDCRSLRFCAAYFGSRNFFSREQITKIMEVLWNRIL